MALEIEEAVREQMLLRMAIQGRSGAGKSATGLFTATEIARRYNGRVGVIDTQNKQSLVYSGGEFAPDGFKVIHLRSGSPEVMANAIAKFEMDKDVVVVFIDSLSITWAGKDGILEEADANADNSTKFSQWKGLGKKQNTLLDKIMGSRFHIICSLQSKTDWAMVQTTNAKGNAVTAPIEVGTAPVQRDGIKYLFPVYCVMDDQTLTVDRINDCPTLHKKRFYKPKKDWTEPLLEWLSTGKVIADLGQLPQAASDEQVAEYFSLVLKAGLSVEEGKARFVAKYGFNPADCTAEFMNERIEDLRGKIASMPKAPVAPKEK